MHITARWFVFIVFVVLGASFVATTGLLVWEFRRHEWLALMTMDSHLFVFFPTFGIVALFAFFLPACAFVDHYWYHVRPLGPVRFWGWLAVVCAASWAISSVLLDTPSRAIWEIAPAVLESDRGEPTGCDTGSVECKRLPILDSVRALRSISTQRLGLAKLVRSCNPDPLIERTTDQQLKRICIATTRYSSKPRLEDDATCCAAQVRHVAAVRWLYDDPASRSITGRWHAWLLPLKIFFLLVLLVMSALLAVWSQTISRRYAAKLVAIEFGIIVGIVAVLFFPLMAQAFLQSYRVMAGPAGEGTFSAIVPAITVIVVIWAVLMVMFFYRRRDKELERIGKLAGLSAGAFALIKIDELVSILVYALGSGASTISLALLIGFSFVLVFILAQTTLRGALSPVEMAQASEAAKKVAPTSTGDVAAAPPPVARNTTITQ